jgi:hypothetical protein
MRSWLQRQWTSVVLIGTGWIVIVAGVVQKPARDGFAVVCVVAGLLLVAIGALHHRGIQGSAGPTGLQVSVPPESPPQAIARLATLPHYPQPDALPEDETSDLARVFLGNQVLDSMIRRPGPPLDDCVAQVWLFDADEGVLRGILEPDRPGEPVFRPGQGAVGMAWETGSYVIAEGDSVRDDTFGLTDEMQRRYADMAVALAVPVTNEAGETIAALSAGTRNPQSELAHEAGLDHLLYLSELVARVLIDLFMWFDDGYPDRPQEA